MLGPLHPGDRVAVVAPAGPAQPGQVERAGALLRSWGLDPVVSPSARVVATGEGFLAGPDAVRAADLQQAWCDPSVAGIFCLRGGAGSIRILDRLDVAAFRAARPKPLYGSSDITAVHEWLAEVVGAPSWFTPMVGTAAVLGDPVAAARLAEAVLVPYRSRTWTSPTAVPLVPGSATGILVGGNVTVLAATVGARSRPPVDHTGSLVLLEDVNEEPYRIDRCLQTLLRSGWFDGIAGVGLGSWQGCGPVAAIHDLVRELLGPLGVPIAGELGFGHCRGAHSIPLGVSATLRTDEVRTELTVGGSA